MKTLLTLVIVFCLLGCSQEVPFSEPKQEKNFPPTNVNPQKIEANKPEIIDIKVVNWGPQNALTGTNPNRQPDESLGLWFQLNTTKGLSKVTIFFDNHPALSVTVADETLITASISEDLIKKSGPKSVSLRNAENGAEIFNSTFTVSNN